MKPLRLQAMDSNQYQVYLGWVNAQLKKRKEPQLITDLQTDLADGTILADLIEVVAGERVEMINSPASHTEKVTNVDRVLRFMKTNRIPMHPIRAEDIVSGDIRSIMRLILALAARYKPNTVRQTSRHANQKTSSRMSVVGYAQSAVTALADARRSASVVVPKPRKPGPLNDPVGLAGGTSSELSHISGNNSAQPGQSGSRSSSTSFRSSQSIPKSSSQDFSSHSVHSDGMENDAKYQDLVASYHVLETDHKELRNKYDHLQSVCHDLSTETRILGKMLLSLKQLLEMEDYEENVDDFERMSSGIPDEGLALADVAVLKNRLNLSEEICSDVKEDLSKTRNECLRLQGAEVGLHQRLRQQQKVQFDLKAELRRAQHEIQFLQSSKSNLEKQLMANDEWVAELSRDDFLSIHESIKKLRSYFGSDNPGCETIDQLEDEIVTLFNRLCLREPFAKKNQVGQGSKQDINCDPPLYKTPGLPVQRLDMKSHQATSSKVIYFVGRNEVPLMCSIDKPLADVRLKDVKRLLKAKQHCRYQFRNHDPQIGFVKEEISHDDAPVPGFDGIIMVWLEDDVK